MAEWSKAQHWKCCVRATAPWVRIPPSPPISSKAFTLSDLCRQIPYHAYPRKSKAFASLNSFSRCTEEPLKRRLFSRFSSLFKAFSLKGCTEVTPVQNIHNIHKTNTFHKILYFHRFENSACIPSSSQSEPFRLICRTSPIESIHYRDSIPIIHENVN